MEGKQAKSAYTLIGEGAVVDGVVQVPHPLRIDGALKGKLQTAEMLTVGVTATVEADVIARSAVIGGTVKGNVTVHDRVELQSKASLIGDLRAREVVINEGAVFHGNCSMDTAKGPRV